MKRTNLSILVGLVSALAVILIVSAVYPSVDDLWIENPFWNGLSKFYVEYNPLRMKDFSELEAVLFPENSTLFIIGPYAEFSESDVVSLKFFLARGGTLVLMDDTGTGNQLLESMNIESRFSSGILVDPVFRERNMHMPRALTNIPSVGSIVMNYATSLNGIDDRYVFVWSSPTSYLLSYEREPIELYSQPVVAKIPIYNGWLVLISDSSIFINSMIDRADNILLLEWLASDQVIIDEAHGSSSRLGWVKSILAEAQTFLGFYEIRYTFVGLISLVLLRSKINLSEKPIDPVEELLRKHPEYDRNMLEWLEKQRHVK